MFRFIRSATGSRPQRAGARCPGQEIRAEGGEAESTSDSPRYPPYDSGIEIRQIDEIVATQSALIGRIYRTAGVSREEFAERFEPALRNLARYVHLVPATATSNHRLEGGLFRFSLEVGLYAMQAANASVFPTSGGVERRYYMQPKWSLATFLAGLCSQTYRVINNMAIVDRANAQWPPLLVPLYDWALSVKTDVYFIRWLQERDDAGAQASSAYLVSRIIAPEVLQYLCADNNQVIPFMTAAITGAQISASDNPIARIVAPLTSRVIEEDLKRTPTHYGRGSIGFHIEPHLIDAMRRLLRSGTWSCNHREAVVWVGTDGVFVKWDTAAADVIQLLNTDNFVGVPRDPDTLADMLCESGVLERTPERARYWTITTPDPAEVLDNVVKLRQRDLIFPRGFDFSPFESVTLLWRAAPAEALFGKEPEAGKERAGTPPDAVLAEAQPRPREPSRATPPASGSPSAAPPDRVGAASLRGASDSPPSRQDRATSGEHSKAMNRARVAPDPASSLSPSVPAPLVSSLDNVVSAPSPSPSQPEKLLDSLQKENARPLQEFLDSVLADKPIGVTASLPQGYGISIDSIPMRGQPVMDLLDELAAKQWLWVDKTKPTRKLHRIEVGTAVCRMLVLRPEIAQGLGLPWAGRSS